MQNFEVWFLLKDNGPISGSQKLSTFEFPTHFAFKTVKWLNFHEKYENTNYSTVNACGLAIFQNFTFIGSSVIYLSLSKIPIWTHQSPFGLRKKQIRVVSVSGGNDFCIALVTWYLCIISMLTHFKRNTFSIYSV
jgi:hypothetical protein